MPLTRLRVVAGRVLLVGLLVAYVRWLLPAMGPYAGSADSAGYLWSARLLAQGRASLPIDRSLRLPDSLTPDVFAPLGTAVRPNTWDLVPTYPAGFPLHIAALSQFLDEARAVLWTLVLGVGGTLWLTYRLGRAAGLDRAWSAVGPALLGCSPLFLFLAVQPLSDVLATFWALVVVLCAWRSRRHPGTALVTGAALGCATLVRPTSLVMALPLLVALPWSRERLLRLAAGGAPFVVFLALYQASLYGSPFRSGYGDVRTAFSLEYVPGTLRHYATWMPQLCSWLVLLAPGTVWAWRGDLARWRWITAAWLLAVFGTYAAYYHTSETWWYLRFVLPGVPPLLVASLVTCQAVVRLVRTRLPRAASATVAAAAVVLVAGGSVRMLVRHPLFPEHLSVKIGERAYSEVLQWMSFTGSGGRPVLMTQLGGAALYYAPQVHALRFDRLSVEQWRDLRTWQAASGLAIDAALFPFERDEVVGSGRERFTCDWRARDAYRSVTFWLCPPPGADAAAGEK